MLKRLVAYLSFAALGAASPASAREAAAEACNRACMTELADELVASIVAHKPQDVPLTDYYKATNSGIPASLPFMDLWRTISAAGVREYYIDTVSQQMFVMVSVSEGEAASLLWGRLKLSNRKFSELELHLTRSRGDAGFIFGDGELYLPPNWTKPVAATRIPDRESMMKIGRAMFSPALPLPPQGAGCELLENGAQVREEAEWMQYFRLDDLAGVSGGAPAKSQPEKPSEQPALMGDMGCPLLPGRPGDETARVDVIDQEKGVVVSIAKVEGLIYNYPVTMPTWSAFVPRDMLSMHEATLKRAMATGKYRNPKVVTMPAGIIVGQAFRIYDGKVQGFHMLQKLVPTGSVSPWTLPPVDAPGNGQ